MASEVADRGEVSEQEQEDGGFDPREELLVLEDGSANSNYRVFNFRSDLGPGDLHDIPIILITQIDTKILVAIPFSFWHRLTRQRFLPSAALSKAVSVAAAAVEDSHRDVAVENVFIKVWIGLLSPRFEECLEPATEEVALGFLTEDQEEGFVPMAKALMAVADEKFAFLTAESASAIQAEMELKDRLSALEAGMMNIQDTLKTLGQPKAVPNATAALLPPKPKRGSMVGGLGDGDGIAGLDPGAVKAALQSGIDRAQLEELSALLGTKKGKLTDAPGAKVPANRALKLNILGETEGEEAEEEEEAAVPQLTPEELKDPMVTALTKLTSIVGSLAAGKRRTRLEETLDDAVLHQDSGGTSSSSSSRRHSAVIQSLRKALKDHPEELYAVMERRMLDDFGSVEEAPGGGKRSGSFRGWAEHRSRIPNIPATVRTVWGITGALDALRNNRVAEGKARLLLLLAQIDQLAVDRGQALLSAEGSLEDAPPFSSFAKHLPPDIYEGQHTKLWPSTWAEAFMWKVKELDDFVERRQRLGKRVQPPRPEPIPPTPTPKGDPKRVKPKGGGKGQKNSEASAASEEASSSSQQ